MYAKSYDLGVVAVIAFAAVGLAFIGATNPATGVLFGLPLVLLLPGYAVVAAAFTRRTLGVPERLLFSLGLSLAIVALSGLLLNLTSWGLQAGTWSIWLAIVTLGACTVAWLRRRHEFPLAAPSQLNTGLDIRQGAILVLALAVVIGAIAIARMGADQSSTSFTQLWMLPASAANSNTVNLGVSNMENTTEKYKLDLTVGDKVLQEWPTIELQPGKEWQVSAVLPSNQATTSQVVAILYRLDQPGTVYRKVTLAH